MGMSREEAITILQTMEYELSNQVGGAYYIKNTYCRKKYDAIRAAIKALEQETKTGHWIMTSDYLTTAYGSVDYVKCSCCGEDSLEEGNYCPNCGCRMESDNNVNE